jgi:archaellum biogenesis protein FlaJ (TadC family)
MDRLPRFTLRFICKIDIILNMAEISDEDRQRVEFLRRISSSKHEFKKFSLEELKQLQELVEKKDYSHDKKAQKSKQKLLNKINTRIYELEEGRGIFY